MICKICPYYEDVIRKLLENKHNVTCLTPRYLSGVTRYDYETHHNIDFYFKNFINNNIRLDEATLNSFEKTEFNFLCNSDRLTYKNVPIKKRRLIFRSLLVYWLRHFNNNQYDLVLFGTTPHQMVDVIIWDIAKSKSIPACYVERALLFDTIFFRWNLTKVPAHDQRLNALDRNKLLTKFNSCNFQRNLDSNPYTTRSKKNAHTKNLFPNAGHLLRKSVSNFRRIWERKPNKYNLGTLSLLEPGDTFFDHYRFKLKKLLYDRSMFLAYQAMSQKPNMERDRFVLFGMQLQPERSSFPLAGNFDDQITAVKMLSESVPDEVTIYVKEHPKLLCNPNLTSFNYRDILYYDLLSSFRNVKLVDINVSTERLIEKAEAIFTLTGSVGWEGLLQGKKVGVFGSPWYGGCSAANRINSSRDIEDVLSKKVSKTNIQDEIKKFLITYSSFFIKGKAGITFADQSASNYHEFVSNFVNSIENYEGYKKNWDRLMRQISHRQ